MSDLPKVIGERIRNLRTEKGLSQEDLAHLSSLHSTYIGQLERGEKNATLVSIEKIASALEVTFEELFRFIKPVKDNKELFILSQIVNRLQARDIKDQETVLKLLDLIFEWKDELR